ncbi:hypothetical protein CLV47_110136 [Antricoccus suffuscus]|uniref:Cell division protein FtsB n=1 Tax=Antricoccus suffuscus TaxID=1629062 RepID=A0A2T0ZZ89_9ACTN|nr:hypothetical protein [Antricoccus suffuscus]PRZ41408.1 hypothetical protein CLV47_110136 [Antricoccus suffuscus]
MSTTFSGAKVARSANTSTKPRTKTPHPKTPSRYTQARREARENARKRTVRHQLLQTHKSLRTEGLAKVRTARWPFVTLFAVIAAGAVIALLMLNTATAQTSFVQRNLNAKLDALTIKQQKLEEQVSKKQSPTYLAQKAAELGLAPGGQPGYFVINPDGSSKFVEPDPKKAGTEPPPPAGDPENPAAGASAPDAATTTPTAPGAAQ